MKRIICVLLLLITVLTSCSSGSTGGNVTPSPNNGGNNSPNSNSNNSSNNNNNNNNSVTTNPNLVYNKYSNISQIGEFYNGLAPFLIYKSGSESFWVGWQGFYYLGFINIKGEVVVEPTYEYAPIIELTGFEYEYLRTGGFQKYTNVGSKKQYLIDKTGNVIFESEKDSITGIGQVSEGYFWLETLKEDISGRVYTVEYYRVKDMKVVATFTNVRAIPENYIAPDKSTLSKQGDGKLIRGTINSSYNTSNLISFNIADYDPTYTPSPTLEWTVDIKKIDTLSAASLHYYHPSKYNNDLGQIATVALRNSSGTWFYAIVDENGNVLMQPQQDIAFPVSNESDINKYDFCQNLCPAQDVTSGKWGYIDPTGKWVIQPQYSSANSFSKDGYATVNKTTVIDTTGKVILSPSTK